MKRWFLSYYPLLLIILLAFMVRLYRFDGPIADWHSWRQADTSAVSRNFVQNGYDVAHPRFDDLSNIPSGMNNPNGYRFVEFPLYNILQAGSFQVFGIFSLEQWGRLVTILGSLFSIMFLYLLVTKYSNKTVGLFTAFFYAVLPYNIYYGRTILPDPSMVTATLGGIYFFSLWAQESAKRKVYYFLALLCTAAAFLLKPYAGFFMLPMLYIAYKAFGLPLWKKWQLWVFAFFSILPFVAWRLWITQYPEGIPANTWLLNGNGIRFRPAFFRWIGYERLIKLISGYFGIIIVLFGVFASRKVQHWGFFASFALSSLLYVTIFATGNVQHDYYQILIMPSVAIFYGLGAYFLYDKFKIGKSFALGKIILLLCTVGALYFSWQQVKDYFNINNEAMVRAGIAVDHLTPKDAKVIAPLDGDTSFLYQTKRKGWPSFQNDLPIMINELGADYLVIVHPRPQDYTSLEKQYKLVSKTDEYILVKLSKKP